MMSLAWSGGATSRGFRARGPRRDVAAEKIVGGAQGSSGVAANEVMAHKHQFLRKIGTAALGAALAFGLGSLSASASTGGGTASTRRAAA